MPQWARWVIAGLLSLIALSAQAQLPQTQCVSTALASGTGDAIAIPLLPCTETTTLLVLTIAAANTSTAPTISVNGQTPHTILNFDGTALGIGVFQPNQRRILTYNGLNWIVLNGTVSSSPSPCGNNPGATLGFFPVLIKTTSYTVQLTDQCSFIVYEGGGAGTFTLPPPTAGFVFWVVNLSASNLTLQPPIGHVNLETSLIVPTGSGGMLDSDGTPDSWFFAFSPPGGGGGGCGGSNGVAGQDCVSTGGSGGVWAQEVIGAPGPTPGDGGSTTTIQGGAGNTDGPGGDLTLASGLPGSAGSSGNITISTPNAASGSSAGNITISTGASGGSTPSPDIYIVAGNDLTSSDTQGTITIAQGITADSLFRSFIALGHNNQGATDAGDVSIVGCDNNTGPGCSVGIRSGASASGSPGGMAFTTPNAAAGDIAGPNVTTTAGNGHGTQPGGTIGFAAGNGGATNGNAGNITLNPGEPAGTGRTGVVRAGVDSHIALAGQSPPVISACGTLPAFARNSGGDWAGDNSGVITAGTGGVTACTITFQRPFNSDDGGTGVPPACMAMVYSSTPIASGLSSISTTAVTFTFAADISSKSFSYWCPQ